MTARHTGIVKWYNPDKGFGFIVPDHAGKDVFLHVSALTQAKIKSVQPGQRLEYELKESRGKMAAASICILPPAEGDPHE